MMLENDQAGEVAAAAGALKRTLAGVGMDPHTFAAAVASSLSGAPALVPLHDRDGDDWRSIVAHCLKHRDRLPGKEVTFLRGLLEYETTLSARQRKWLLDIRDRLREGVHS